MIAHATTFGKLHRELVTNCHRLNSIDRGRLTRIRTKAGGLTYRDAAWIQRKYEELMSKIDDVTAIEIYKARQQVRKHESNVAVVGEDFKAAKKELDKAQEQLNALLDESMSPNLFANE